MIVLYFKSKQLRLAVGLIAAVCLLLLAGLLLSPKLMTVAATGKKPVYSVERNDAHIALSFDASWGATHTEDLLKLLEQYEVKTTFFLVNLWIEDYPELVKEIDAAGHEIGLHSATHPHFTALSVAEMEKELEANAEALYALTDKTASLFRPPYGDYNDEVIETVESMGLTAVQWSVDSLDWQGGSGEEIAERILTAVKSGDIVLLHNNGDHTVEALALLLPALKEKGFKIVPVGALLPEGDYYIDQNGIMRGK